MLVVPSIRPGGGLAASTLVDEQAHPHALAVPFVVKKMGLWRPRPIRKPHDVHRALAPARSRVRAGDV